MPARTLPGLGLRGFWNDGEHNWGTFHSEDLRKMSALLHCKVLDIVAATPGSPTDGDIYLFSAAHPTDAKKIAVRDNGAWVLIVPIEGFSVWVADENIKYDFDGAAWVPRLKGGYSVGGFFNLAPEASETLVRHIFAENITFADDFAGSQGHVVVNPATSFVIDVKKNGASVGTITVSAGGVFTFSTTAGALAVIPGDRITLDAPATPSAVIAGLSVTLLGSR